MYWSDRLASKQQKAQAVLLALEAFYGMQPNPTEFKYDTIVPEPARATCCPRHEQCLDVGVAGGWASLSCGSCPIYAYERAFNEKARKEHLLKLASERKSECDEAGGKGEPNWLYSCVNTATQKARFDKRLAEEGERKPLTASDPAGNLTPGTPRGKKYPYTRETPSSAQRMCLTASQHLQTGDSK